MHPKLKTLLLAGLNKVEKRCDVGVNPASDILQIKKYNIEPIQHFLRGEPEPTVKTENVYPVYLIMVIV